MTSRHVVYIGDKAFDITIYRKSKTVWAAVGDYHGQRIQSSGSSPTAAAKHWAAAARYRSKRVLFA